MQSVRGGVGTFSDIALRTSRGSGGIRPFDRPSVDHLRARRVIRQGRPCQSPSPPLPIGPLSGSVQQAGDPPDASLFVPGKGLTNSYVWIASRRSRDGRPRRDCYATGSAAADAMLNRK